MSWDDTVAAWSRPPVDDVGYLSSEDMLGWPDDKLKATISAMRETRYSGWRNHQGLWRRFLGLDEAKHGKRVLEYGCGVGMEAAEIARTGATVSIADLSSTNVELSARVIYLMTGHGPKNMYRILEDWPYIHALNDVYDEINCCGVLHHIRKAQLTMDMFSMLLRPGGKLRLMVYSDEGWRIATGTEPPPEPVETAEGFGRFVSFMDGTGDYATWYDKEKLTRRFGDLFEITEFAYLTWDRRYCAAVLTRKEYV